MERTRNDKNGFAPAIRDMRGRRENWDRVKNSDSECLSNENLYHEANTWQSTLGALGIIVSLLFLCSCATIHSPLPADVAINKTAGRGGWLYVTLHFNDRQGLRFLLDTGSPYTVLEKSLEPKLGKRLGTAEIQAPWYGSKLNLYGYPSPKLYLGNTRLLLGDWILAGDFQIWDGPHVSGILGMDCLRHYSIQMDFANGKIRFLDPDNLKTEELGRAFPLTFSKDGCPCIQGTLIGSSNLISEIDTGLPGDGALEPKLFEKELQKQKDAQAKEYKTATGQAGRYARFPATVFADENYTNLSLAEYPNGNVIGLRFLARNLVTLNFPRRTMYLKQTSNGPSVITEN